jgi:ORF6N domain
MTADILLVEMERTEAAAICGHFGKLTHPVPRARQRQFQGLGGSGVPPLDREKAAGCRFYRIYPRTTPLARNDPRPHDTTCNLEVTICDLKRHPADLYQRQQGSVNMARNKSGNENAPVPLERISRSILLVRGKKGHIGQCVGGIRAVELRTMNQVVKRNLDRFPTDFMFQLSAEEAVALRSQSVTLKEKHRFRGM